MILYPIAYDVVRLAQGQAPAVVYSFDYAGSKLPQRDAEGICRILNRLAADRLVNYVVREREGAL